LPDSPIFAHGIASGDPLTDRVVIWTRIGLDQASVPVTWKVGRDAELIDVVASGETIAEPHRDHTVHVDVAGLEPGVVYHYGFEAAGEVSPTGRTLVAEVEEALRASGLWRGCWRPRRWSVWLGPL
jgi:alkaline phosphatase D